MVDYNAHFAFWFIFDHQVAALHSQSNAPASDRVQQQPNIVYIRRLAARKFLVKSVSICTCDDVLQRPTGVGAYLAYLSYRRRQITATILSLTGRGAGPEIADRLSHRGAVQTTDQWQWQCLCGVPVAVPQHSHSDSHSVCQCG